MVLGIKTIFLEFVRCKMEKNTQRKIHTTQNLRGSPLGLRPQSCSDLSL
jgi:hypothetical protein